MSTYAAQADRIALACLDSDEVDLDAAMIAAALTSAHTAGRREGVEEAAVIVDGCAEAHRSFGTKIGERRASWHAAAAHAIRSHGIRALLTPETEERREVTHDPDRGCAGCDFEIMDSAVDIFCAMRPSIRSVSGRGPAPAECPLRETAPDSESSAPETEERDDG